MPRRLFAHREDAAEQLRLGVEAHTRRFGTRPRGIWPPEAAVSDDVARLAADQGLEWMLSDEGILARSSGNPISRDGDGQVMQPELLYEPYRVQTGSAPIQLVFRDGRLSNAIGFEYQNSAPDEAAKDLIDRLHAVQRRQQDTPLLAVIALDGENCWDFYEANGNDFLRALYSRLSHDPDLKTVTVSEFLAEFPTQRSLASIHPGSWINANFDTWVGDQEHNVAWELLSEARDFLSEREGQATAPAQFAAARREALIAEGSDWFWWFGRSHDSGMDQIWDSLFRLHLRNIYMSCQQPPPASLYQPIVKEGESSASKRPDRKITPKLNGVIDHDEWSAGGYVDVTALFGAMHPPTGAVRRIWFGHDDHNLYLRFDLLGGEQAPRAVELEMLFSASPGRRRGDNPTPSGRAKRTARGDFGFDPAYRLKARRDGGEFELELREMTQAAAGAPPRWAGRASADEALAFAIPFEALGQDRGERAHLLHRKPAILRPRGHVRFLGRRRPIHLLQPGRARDAAPNWVSTGRDPRQRLAYRGHSQHAGPPLCLRPILCGHRDRAHHSQPRVSGRLRLRHAPPGGSRTVGPDQGGHPGSRRHRQPARSRPVLFRCRQHRQQSIRRGDSHTGIRRKNGSPAPGVSRQAARDHQRYRLRGLRPTDRCLDRGPL